MKKISQNGVLFDLDDPKEAREYLKRERINWVELDDRRVMLKDMTDEDAVSCAVHIWELNLMDERDKSVSH